MLVELSGCRWGRRSTPYPSPSCCTRPFASRLGRKFLFVIYTCADLPVIQLKLLPVLPVLFSKPGGTSKSPLLRMPVTLLVTSLSRAPAPATASAPASVPANSSGISSSSLLSSLSSRRRSLRRPYQPSLLFPRAHKRQPMVPVTFFFLLDDH